MLNLTPKRNHNEWSLALTKSKLNTLESFELTEQCLDNTLALVTEMNGDTSGVSSWPESSVFVVTENHSG